MMRLQCGWTAWLGLVGCLLVSGCSKSNTAEMPTKVVPRPSGGLPTGQPAPPGGDTANGATDGSAAVAPDPGSP